MALNAFAHILRQYFSDLAMKKYRFYLGSTPPSENILRAVFLRVGALCKCIFGVTKPEL